SSANEIVKAWSPDGKYIAYLTGSDNLIQDIYAKPMSGDGKPFPVVTGHFQKSEPQFSYDGKWLAYTSDASGGMFQVFVVAFPAGDKKVQVSTSGGGQPRWNRNGKELFYRNNVDLMAVDIAVGDRITPGNPRFLFSPGNEVVSGNPSRHQLAVRTDG